MKTLSKSPVQSAPKGDPTLSPLLRLKAQFVQAALNGILSSQEEAVPATDDDVIVERALTIGELAFTRFLEENAHLATVQKFNQQIGLGL